MNLLLVDQNVYSLSLSHANTNHPALRGNSTQCASVHVKIFFSLSYFCVLNDYCFSMKRHFSLSLHSHLVTPWILMSDRVCLFISRPLEGGKFLTSSSCC
jgi:hypothetical protein